MLEKLYNNPQKSLYIFIVLMAIFSTLYNAFIPLHGDEAYYWMWSKHLQSGYYDHPPMIAYLIYFTNFISDAEWSVRLVNVFSFSVASLYIFKLTTEISNEKTALNAVIIFFSVLVVQAGYIITTPDSPLIMFWTLSLYYTYRAIFHDKLKDYLLSGLMLGFAMLSKYSAILLVISILLYIIIKRRDILLNYKIYIAMVLALIVILPMLYWNYKNDWISFLFQLNHGATESFKIKIGKMLEFFGGQFGVFSPVFAWVLFYYLIKEKFFFKDNRLFFISLTVIVTLGLFLYKSLFKSMALNYGAPAYIGGVILVAYVISKYELKKTFKIGLLIAILLSVMARYMFLFHLDIIREEMYKSDKVIEKFLSYKKPTDKLYADHLTNAAYIEYYSPTHELADVVIPARFSQYDMWRKKDYLQNGIVLTRYRPREKELKKLYKNVKLLEHYIVIPKVRSFYIYRVWEPIK
ncbi:ArnT family glycosyltransferase [Sulfurimonas sp.]